MKKLMIAAFAVAFAAVAQAASVDWTATTLYTYDGVNSPVSATGNSVYAYLFLDTNEANLASTMANITGALANGDRTAVTGFAGAKGNSLLNRIAADSEHPIDGLSATTYYGQMLIVNAGDVAAATWFYTSNVKDVTLDPATTTTMAFGNQKTAGMNSAGAWTEIAPEPTSGLMMLLGMGVLALRRRRA